MPSPALDAFTTWVDQQAVSAGVKAAVKARGEQLYTAAIQEEAAHVVRHLDAEMSTATGEDLTRLQVLRVVIASITTDDAPAAADVATYILTTTDAEREWGRALGGLLTSKTRAAASAYWDVLLTRYDTPGVRARLQALRDLITTKFGA